MEGLFSLPTKTTNNLETKPTTNTSDIPVIIADLDIEKTLTLKDMNFKNVGNTSDSKNYKDILKDVFNNTIELVKEKIFNENFLDKLENFDPKQIENKVKDKLKNKLKKLIN